MDRNIRAKFARNELAAALGAVLADKIVKEYGEVTLGELRKKETEFPTTLDVTVAEAEAVMLAVSKIIANAHATATNGGTAVGEIIIRGTSGGIKI